MLYIEDRDQLLTVSMSQSLSPIQISFLFKEIRVSKQLVFIHQFGHIIWFVANLIVWCFIVANLIVWCFISILLIWIWIYSDSFKCLQVWLKILWLETFAKLDTNLIASEHVQILKYYNLKCANLDEHMNIAKSYCTCKSGTMSSM